MKFTKCAAYAKVRRKGGTIDVIIAGGYGDPVTCQHPHMTL